MERLVEKLDNGMILLRNDDASTYNAAMKRLYEYEDLDEKGLLLRLPCKVGDTVYKIPSQTNYKLNILNGYSENNRVYEQKVNKIELFGNGSYVLVTCDGMDGVVSDFFNETWFLTRKQADKKLKELQKEGYKQWED